DADGLRRPSPTYGFFGVAIDGASGNLIGGGAPGGGLGGGALRPRHGSSGGAAPGGRALHPSPHEQLPLHKNGAAISPPLPLPTGTSPGGGAGIYILDSSNNKVGAAGAGNLISWNYAAGVDIEGRLQAGNTVAGASGNTVAGNLIGTNASGGALVPVPNG